MWRFDGAAIDKSSESHYFRDAPSRYAAELICPTADLAGTLREIPLPGNRRCD